MAFKLARSPFSRFDKEKIRNRAVSAVVVSLGHVLAVMLIWASKPPIERETIVPEAETMVFFPLSTGARHSDERGGIARLKPLNLKRAKPDVSESLQSIVQSIAKLPPLPESAAPSGVDWQSEITDVASDVIERARVEAGRAMDRPPRSPSFSPLYQ